MLRKMTAIAVLFAFAGTSCAFAASEPPLEEISLVFHNITWTYEPSRADTKETILKSADGCTRSKPRKSAEDCLRRHGWKPARK